MPKIIVVDGGTKKVHEIGPEGFTIGRSSDNDHVAVGQKCSRQHCKFVVAGEGAAVTDLGSRNGTFVNGGKVQQKRLRPGDVIKVGDVTVFFEREGGEQSQMAPCPSCFNMIPKGATVCEHCGEGNEELAFLPRCTVCQEEQDHKGAFCTKCGANIRTGKGSPTCVLCHQVILDAPELCPACGQSPYPQTQDEIEEEEQTATEKEKSVKMMYGIIAVVAAGMGYGFALLIAPSPPAKPSAVEREAESADGSRVAATTATAALVDASTLTTLPAGTSTAAPVLAVPVVPATTPTAAPTQTAAPAAGGEAGAGEMPGPPPPE